MYRSFTAFLLAITPNSHTQDIFHSLRSFLLRRGSDMGIGIQSEPCGEVAQHTADCFDVHPILQGECCEGMTKLVEAENAICYDIVRGYGLRRSLLGRRGGFSWHEKAENISTQKWLDLLLPMQ